MSCAGPSESPDVQERKRVRVEEGSPIFGSRINLPKLTPRLYADDSGVTR